MTGFHFYNLYSYLALAVEYYRKEKDGANSDKILLKCKWHEFLDNEVCVKLGTLMTIIVKSIWHILCSSTSSSLYSLRWKYWDNYRGFIFLLPQKELRALEPHFLNCIFCFIFSAHIKKKKKKISVRQVTFSDISSHFWKVKLGNPKKYFFLQSWVQIS